MSSTWVPWLRALSLVQCGFRAVSSRHYLPRSLTTGESWGTNVNSFRYCFFRLSSRRVFQQKPSFLLESHKSKSLFVDFIGSIENDGTDQLYSVKLMHRILLYNSARPLVILDWLISSDPTISAVIPAKAGDHLMLKASQNLRSYMAQNIAWVPAFMGMTA